MRTFTWSAEFCRHLETEIRRQATFPEFDTPTWYQDTVDEIYRKFPIDDMIERDVLASCLAED